MTEENVEVSLLGQPYINPENGQIIAFLTGWSVGLAPIDIVTVHQSHIVVRDEEVQLPLADFWRLQEWGYARARWLGKKVYSKSNIYLGRVDDLQFTHDLAQVLNFHVSKHWLVWSWGERIFTWGQVDEVTDKAIFLNVDLEATLKSSQSQTETVTAY